MGVTRDEWDEQCGRWRWQDGENFVVYPLGEGCVRVLDERTGVTWQVLNKEVNIDSGVPPLYRSAARDYFTAHEPKPWHEAKPGEVWLLESWALETAQVVDGYSTFRPWGVDVKSNGNARGTITAGRRIWPEAADA